MPLRWYWRKGVIFGSPKGLVVWSIKLKDWKRKAAFVSVVRFGSLLWQLIHVYITFYIIYPSRHIDVVLTSLSSRRADPMYEAIQYVDQVQKKQQRSHGHIFLSHPWPLARAVYCVVGGYQKHSWTWRAFIQALEFARNRQYQARSYTSSNIIFKIHMYYVPCILVKSRGCCRHRANSITWRTYRVATYCFYWRDR